MQKDKKISPNFQVKLNEKLKQQCQRISSIQQCYFPYPPYPQQIKVINSINKSIINSQNALIQSPTGTGKTLCLLTGSLSALVKLKNKSIKIFYLTRTHSQISQVIEEIKKTPYILRVNIIASRDHLCTNPNLKQMKGKTLEKACNDLVSNKTCLFKESSEKRLRIKQPLKLESFKEQCKKQLICPFFHSRQLTEKTQISILPFNYFLDWKIFQTFSHLIKNSILIFDEAHNVDSIAEEGSNLQIDSKTLKLAINELKSLARKFKRQFQSNQKNRMQIQYAIRVLERLKTQISQQSNKKTFCSKSQLEEFIYTSTQVPDPQDITEMIQGLQLKNSGPFFQKLHQSTKLFYKKQTIPSSWFNIISNLEKISVLYKSQNFEKDFIVKIGGDQNQNVSLRLKCLSPSVGFFKIKQQQPRSIILSSGTLGNLDKWQKYLSVPFQQKLSIQSFITKDQLFASIVVKSSSNYAFQFSYQRKDYENQHQQVVLQLKQIQAIVPKKNGIVVAFSTYLLMQKVIKYCSIHLKKPVFYESKGSDVTLVFNQYSKAVRENQGAFLFIIMKGRFSQGINFSDQLCRCLIVVGIPFLPRKENSVFDKMKYLSENFGDSQAQQWYKNQTFQAVNQTIGRVIRSKKDYGCILLFDQRYQKKQNFSLLSSWFKKSLRMCQSHNIYNTIKQFFQSKSWQKCLVNENVNTNRQLQQNTRSQATSAKTIKVEKKKKRHLKLSYDTEQAQNICQNGDLDSTSRNQNINIQRSLKFQQQKTKRSNTIDQGQVSNSSTKLIQKTPQKKIQRKLLTSSASVVLSKINIDKKNKLKAFINRKFCNLVSNEQKMSEPKKIMLKDLTVKGESDDDESYEQKYEKLQSNKKIKIKNEPAQSQIKNIQNVSQPQKLDCQETKVAVIPILTPGYDKNQKASFAIEQNTNSKDKHMRSKKVHDRLARSQIQIDPYVDYFMF